MHSPFINGALGRGCDYLITDDPHRIAANMETTVNYVRQGLCAILRVELFLGLVNLSARAFWTRAADRITGVGVTTERFTR